MFACASQKKTPLFDVCVFHTGSVFVLGCAPLKFAPFFFVYLVTREVFDGVSFVAQDAFFVPGM